jgi:CRP-like cAMP-binding protein
MTGSPTARPSSEAPVLRTISLLEVDPDLAADVPVEDLAEIRERTMVVAAQFDEGPWAPADLGPSAEDAWAILVVDGLLLRDHVIGRTKTSELLGPGDITSPHARHDVLLPALVSWAVAAPTLVALLDDRFVRACATSPAIMSRLLARTALQTTRLARQRAISQLPRVEDRLLALFLHLGERWGHVAPDGIALHLVLTHELLGRLVGARRPTVTLAIRALEEEGHVSRRDNGAWVVRHESAWRLAPNAARRKYLEERPSPHRSAWP